MAETETSVVALHAPRPQTPAERSKAYRRRKGAKKEPKPVVTPSVTSRVTKSVTALPRGASVTLAAAAVGLSGVGIIINGWFARSLGSTDLAGWLFTAIGVAADVAALALPSCAARLWHDCHRGAAAAGWGVWALTFAFAVTAGIGFASVNIADTTLARAGRDTPAITIFRAALADAKAARDRECTKVGPICRQRENTVVDRQHELDTAMRAVEGTADPQTEAAAGLVAWLSVGTLRPDGQDFARIRLLLLALLPQIGGLVLMVARSGA